MKEYKIITTRGFLDSKEWYAKSESAEKLQEEIEEKMAFEISEGMTYRIEPLISTSSSL